MMNFIMNRNLYLVYKTDAWHSSTSYELLGVATTLNQAQKLVIEQVEKEGEPKMSKYTYDFLKYHLQTQNYSGEGEFLIDKIVKNELLS